MNLISYTSHLIIPAPTIFVAFTAGLLSFLAPCVIPVIPSYLSYIGGVSLKEYTSKEYATLRVFTHALAFSLGFVGLFMIIGASIGYLAELFLLHKTLFQQIGGAIIILFLDFPSWAS